jgi:Mn-dependent DtxR family transcriptional regulator
MNERIKALWEEAAKTTPILPYSWDDATSFIERFSHLVVEDTIKEICQQMHWAGDDQSNNPAMYKAIDKTLKEFGIK